MTKTIGDPIDILLVEDNEGDVLLSQIAFKDSEYDCQLHVASDGELAMDFLYQRNDFTDSPTPDIVLLDLNLPKKNGLSVLEDIKNDPDLRRIPVVIMTSSQANTDIVSGYDLQASGYIIKPLSLQKFADMVEGLDKYWFTTVVLPKNME